MNRFQRYRSIFSADLLPLLAVIICAILVAICCTPPKSAFNDKVTELTGGWDAEDGSRALQLNRADLNL